MSEEGVMQKDVMFAKLGFEKDEETKVKLSEIIEKCTALTGDSVCNTAYKVHNCYFSSTNPAPVSA
jgi:PBP/GOBP family